MSLIESLQTIEGTDRLVRELAPLVHRHHAAILMLVCWNSCVTLAVIILAVRARRMS
jgi:hypothetical protein